MLRIIHTSRLNARRLLTSSSCRCQFVAAVDLRWFPVNPKETVKKQMDQSFGGIGPRKNKKKWNYPTAFPHVAWGKYESGCYFSTALDPVFPCQLIQSMNKFLYCLLDCCSLALYNVWWMFMVLSAGCQCKEKGKMLLKWLFKHWIDIEIDGFQCHLTFCCRCSKINAHYKERQILHTRIFQPIGHF